MPTIRRHGPAAGLKARSDVVEALHRRGRLVPEQLEAAREIRLAWEALGRGLFPRARSAECRDLRGWIPEPPSRRPPRDPIERMSGREERIWRTRYRPWAEEMGVEVAARAGRVTRLELCLDIVIGNMRPRRAEALHGLRHGTAVAHLQSALMRYAEMAAWVRPVRDPREKAKAAAEEVFSPRVQLRA